MIGPVTIGRVVAWFMMSFPLIGQRWTIRCRLQGSRPSCAHGQGTSTILPTTSRSSIKRRLTHVRERHHAIDDRYERAGRCVFEQRRDVSASNGFAHVLIHIVDAVRCAERCAAFQFRSARCERDHRCTDLLCEQDARRADTAAGAEHQHGVVGSDRCARHAMRGCVGEQNAS